MRQDILHMLTAVDLAYVVLGWLIVIGGIIYFGSKRDSK